MREKIFSPEYGKSGAGCKERNPGPELRNSMLCAAGLCKERRYERRGATKRGGEKKKRALKDVGKKTVLERKWIGTSHA
jgi:hypothetical protein